MRHTVVQKTAKTATRQMSAERKTSSQSHGVNGKGLPLESSFITKEEAAAETDCYTPAADLYLSAGLSLTGAF